MSEIHLEDLGFSPVTKAPSQISLYGIGTRLYGEKHLEEYPGLYTKVLYFTIFFIPIFAIGKYLAQMHDGNEYILGKGKLAGFSKGWNSVLAAVLAGFIGWNGFQAYTGTPEYIAKNLYEDALEAIEDKDYTKAINNLGAITRGFTTVKPKARQTLNQLTDEKNLAQLEPEEVFNIVKSVASLNGVLKNPIEKFKVYFEKYRETAPKTASDFASLLVEKSKDEKEVQQYNQLNHQLLSEIYDQNQGDFTVAKRYAKLEESFNQCTKCVSILEPFKDKLGLSESARILGQAYALSGQTEEAYKLLSPYVEFNLKAYHQAEKAYNDAINKEWDSTIAFLQSGKAPQSFYNKYDAADEAGKQKLVDDFFVKRRDRSAIINKARDTYSRSTMIVPVALDLGTVLLNRSMTMSNQEERNESLKQAEQTFLSVQNYAGDSDQYQLYLGQVYYWLGQEPKGEELFNNLLAKYDRSHDILYSLAATLRDLGATSKSKDLLLEAYGKVKDKKTKQGYAQFLALLADDLPEKIEWLEKADKSLPHVKGDLLTAKGRLAASEYRKAEALNYFQQSINVYEKISEDATQLNNIALIYLSKYRVSFDAKDFDNALAKLDKAVNLMPEDSIVLSNAAAYHLLKAYTDMQQEKIDLTALEISPNLSTFSFLYRDQKGKDIYVRKLKQHSSYKKGLSYLEKAVLLSPKSVSLLGQLFGVYNFTGDNKAISQLATRFATLKLDLNAEAASLEKYLSGAEDHKNIQQIESYLSDLESRQKKSKNRSNKINRSILSSYWFNSKISSKLYGKKHSADDLLSKARRNYKEVMSSSSRGDLENAIIHKIMESGKKQIPQIANLVKKYGRAIDEETLFALALSSSKQFKAFAKKQSEAKELETLLVQSYNDFPNSPNVTEWYLLKQLGSDSEAMLRQAIKSQPIQADKDLLAYKRTASKEFITVHKYLMLELNNEHEKAKALVESAIKDGVLIPSLGR